MSAITHAAACANNLVVLLAWSIGEPIGDCLGFEITRIYDDDTKKKLVATVPFKGQSNKDGKPQDTGVWPVQKFTWRDLTARQRRNGEGLHPADQSVRYHIRPVVKAAAGLVPVTDIPEKTYEGEPVPLCYGDEGIVTKPVVITGKVDGFQCAFTSGFLSAQWLKRALEKDGEKFTPDVLRAHILKEGDKYRRYLAGDALPTIHAFFKRGADTGGSLLLALYELGDDELTKLIITHKGRLRIILANSSKARGGTVWDAGNGDCRQDLIDNGVDVTHRMFNNAHIGHNKFVVLLDAAGAPQAVLTGSTNWTSTGLCGQSNNVIVIESPDIASQYRDQWDALLADTADFTEPEDFGVGTKNVQAPALRTANAAIPAAVKTAAGSESAVWFSPNTKRTTKGTEIPPDLSVVYSLMRKAKKAIFFASFLPGRNGRTSIIETAIDIGLKDPGMLVYGSISDVTAMPNYIPPPPKPSGGDDDDDDDDGAKEKVDQPNTFEQNHTHIVLASAITYADKIGEFEHEILKLGNAVIHDKIIVIDPLDKECAVITGSHNHGFKASYVNDENLLIVRGHQALARAYVVHVLDIWEHYRMRAVQQERREEGKPVWSGFLDTSDGWQEKSMQGPRAALTAYFSGKGLATGPFG